MRLAHVEVATGARFRWRPFNVRTIMIEMDNIPFRTKPVKAAYMWRDVATSASRSTVYCRSCLRHTRSPNWNGLAASLSSGPPRAGARPIRGRATGGGSKPESLRAASPTFPLD